MNESLQSARNIHQILLVVLTVIGIFAGSIIFETNPFETGLRIVQESEADLDSMILYDKVRIRYDSTGVKVFRKNEIDSSNVAVSKKDTAEINRLKSKIRQENIQHDAEMKRVNKSIRKMRITLDTAENRKDFSLFREAYDLIVELTAGRERQKIYHENIVDLTEQMIEWKDEDFRIIPESNQYVDSLMSLSRLNRILYNSEDQKIFNDPSGQSLGSLDYFYSTNKEKSVKECKDLLTRESANFKNNPKNDVDVSGIRVASKHMYVVAPFLTFCLMVYLSSLVLHLNRATRLRQDAESAQDFPWLALFPGAWSRFLLFISVSVYPAFITWAAASSSELPATQKGYIEIAYPIFFFLLGLSIFVNTLNLSVRIHTRPFV